MGDPDNLRYHDEEWGVEVRGEARLFERLSLEAFQSGLSWLIILRKRPGFRAAFAGFDPEAVAGYGPADVARLMEDASIVRNRAKIEATVANARAVVDLRSDGGLDELVWSYRPASVPGPRSLDEVVSQSPEATALAKDLKSRGFRFVGPTTAHAMMQAVGLVDAHLVDCHRRGCGPS